MAPVTWPATIGLFVLGVLVAGAVGALAVVSPVGALMVAVVAVAVPLAIWMPGLLLVLGFCLFLVSPLNGGLIGRVPEGTLSAQRLLALAVILPYAAHRGVQLRWLAPVAAYIVAGIASYFLGLPIEEWSASQAVRSLISLAVFWVVISVKWDADRDLWILALCALLPVASVALSFLVSPTHLLVPLGGSGAIPRLGGGMIASYLGGAAAAGAGAALLLQSRVGWRYANALVVVNAVICLAAGTRGAILVLLVVLGAAAIPMLTAALRSRTLLSAIRLVLVIVLVPSLTIAGVAINAERSNQTVYNTDTKQNTVDPSSGRFAAWGQFYRLAEESIYFGRGLGAGPVAKIKQQGYNAQHNEYLRLVLELGYIGGGLVALSMVWTLRDRIRRAPLSSQRVLITTVVGFAIFSFTDNTLVVPQITLLFALLIGIGSSSGWSSRAPARAPGLDRPARVPIPA